jgi:ferrous iron transport protein B
MEIPKCCNCAGKKNCSDALKIEEVYKIALVGNPNVGKSVIFNALSGFYAEVSNFPGTTVDISRAFSKEGEIIDTPGAYSLGNYTEDEAVTQQILQEADIVINILSALSIERDLFLTQQMVDLGLPLIIVVNQIDEAEKKGLKIDCARLQDFLGIKVIPTIAIRGQGITEILKSIRNKEYKVSGRKTPAVEKIFQEQNLSGCEKFQKLLEIESNESSDPELKDRIYTERRKIITEIETQVVSEKEKNTDFLEVFGNMLFNPFIGAAAAILLLFLLYQILGVFIAGNIVDFLTKTIDNNYNPWIRNIFSGIIPNHSINEIIVGEFGLLTMTPKLILGVILPLLTGFYLFMAILEDSGYLPRLAILMDNLLSKLGLNGRAVIPVILGFGCSCMGVMTTRILGTKKERTIATAILGLTIPCSAQLGIIIALLSAAGGFKLWIIYIFIVIFILTLTGTVLNKIIPGKVSDLLIDIPPMRMPLFLNTFNKTTFRIVNFLKEAIPMFLAGSLILSILKLVGGLAFLEWAFSPIVKNLLHLPEQFSNAFIMGLIRRDMGATGIIDIADNLSAIQVLTSAVVLTLFVPCIASLIVIYKERGIKEASFIWAGSFIVAITIGAILTRILGFIL